MPASPSFAALSSPRQNTQFILEPSLTAGDDRFSRLDDYLRQEARRLHLPNVAIAVTSGGEIVHEQILGQDLPRDAAFVIGSCSKTITALATLLALEDTGHDIQLSIGDVLPQLRIDGAGGKLTVGQLLSHHSGLTRSQGFDELPTRDELARRRHTLVLHHPPGERYDYCNLNYGLLGLVVETLVDEPFADYVRRRVFVPAGMNSSTCSQTGPKDSWAPEYKYCFGFARRVQATAAPAAQVPAGFIRCSVGDLARLQVILAQDGAIDGRGVFDASIIQQMKSPWGGGKFGYGMGVQTGNYAGEPLLAHEGATPTAYAFHGYLPGRDLGIVLLTNINLFDPFTDHGEAVVKNVFQILADQPPQRVYPVRIWVRWVVLGAVLLAAWRLGRRWLGRRQAPWRWRLPARRNDRVALAASVIVTVVVWYGVLHWTQIRLTALFDLEPDMMWSVVFLTLASLVLDWQQRLAKEDQAETGSAAVRDAASPG